MKWLAIAGGIVALLILVILIIGWSLPVRHVASREATYSIPATQLRALITTTEAFPSWRSKVKSVERESHTRFREIGSDGRILYEVVEQTPDRIVTRIADKDLPFGGSWTYELRAVGANRTTLRITEDGEVYNPIFRFVSRYLMGHTATIDQYLRDIGRHLKEAPSIS